MAADFRKDPVLAENVCIAQAETTNKETIYDDIDNIAHIKLKYETTEIGHMPSYPNMSDFIDTIKRDAAIRLSNEMRRSAEKDRIIAELRDLHFSARMYIQSLEEMGLFEYLKRWIKFNVGRLFK
jgi:hypothetical protein